MAEYWVKFETFGPVSGPYSAQAIRQMAAAGQLSRTALISPDQVHWHPADRVAGLFGAPAGPASAGVSAPLPAGVQNPPGGFPPPPRPVVPPPARPAVPPPPQPFQGAFGPSAYPHPPTSPFPVAQPPPGEIWRGQTFGPDSPGLAWALNLAALVLSPIAAALVINGAQEVGSSASIYFGQLGFISVAGTLGALLCLIGVWRRNALAYRFGVVFGPMGAAFLLLGLLGAYSRMDAPTAAAVLSLAGLGLLTPILWTQAGVRRYFGLCCPQCGGVKIAAEGFAFEERRCTACNTYFRRDGQVLRPGSYSAHPAPGGMMAPPPMVQPMVQPMVPPVMQPMGGMAAAPPVTPMSVPGQPGGVPVMGYAGPSYIPQWGMPGQKRQVGWTVAISVVAVVLLVLAMIGEFASGSQTYGRRSEEPPLAAILNCFGALAALGVWIYWLWWVYTVHREIRDFTGWAHPVSPGKALGYCFIPFFNIYWVIYMPYRLAQTLEQYLGSQRASSGTVMTYQILSIVPGSCLGIGMIFQSLTMIHVQGRLNELWDRAAQAALAQMAQPELVCPGRD